MAYKKASEERKWRYWKEQEEKKLRELGMDEEKIRKLRQMDWEDFLEERRYRERLEETMHRFFLHRFLPQRWQRISMERLSI